MQRGLLVCMMRCFPFRGYCKLLYHFAKPGVLILSCEIASCLPVEEGAQSPESGVYISLFHETGFAIVAI